MNIPQNIDDLLKEAKQRCQLLSECLPKRVDYTAKIPWKAMVCREALIWRTEELARTAYEMFTRNELASAVILTRACMESVAAMWYLQEKIQHVIDTKEAGETANNVIRRLGMEKEIKIIHGDDSDLKNTDWNMALISALAEPKSRIFQTLRQLLKEREHASVVFRTYTGMRAILYEPVKPADIEGFRIVKEILPTGRVNNTTVFAELDE